MSNLTQRLLTALVGVPLVIGAVYLGGWFFVGLMVLVGLLAQRDLYAMAEAGGIRPLKSVGLAVGALVIVRPVWAAALPLAVVGLAGALIAELWRRPLSDAVGGPIPNIGTTCLGVFYPAVLAGYFVELRVLSAEALGETDAVLLTLTAMVAIWAADTLAYFTGRAFGKRPLFPRISPKKTWAGSAGGVLGALAFVAVMKVTLVPLLSWVDVAVIGLVCGAVSQLGDLAESMFKRSVGVKDSGDYLPGHGGMLDRIDAMLIAVPLVVLYLDHVRGIW
ncbi:MAG: phosphatidate cytidylyltransferase [Bacteroidota bacterium]